MTVFIKYLAFVWFVFLCSPSGLVPPPCSWISSADFSETLISSQENKHDLVSFFYFFSKHFNRHKFLTVRHGRGWVMKRAIYL